MLSKTIRKYDKTMEIILDRIAIWKADFHKGYTVRTIPTHTRYQENGVFSYSDKLMYRYAKNYKVGKTEFCLFVRTFRDDKNGVETELDKVAKTIKEDYAKKIAMLSTVENFEYLNEFLKGDK